MGAEVKIYPLPLFKGELEGVHHYQVKKIKDFL